MSDPLLTKATKAIKADQREKAHRENKIRHLRGCPTWDLFAAHALAGFLSGPNRVNPEYAAIYACDCADAAILERNRRING